MGDLYTNKTIFDNEQIGNSNATQPPKVENEKVEFFVGPKIDDYFVSELISEDGNESNVYLVRKNGTDYALKIYKRNINISNSKVLLLQNIKSEYVAPIKDYGTYNNCFYEVYDYYKNGTLENAKKIEAGVLKKYINQLNEGLNVLHHLNQNTGLIHGDIKPSNIFISDDKSHIIIGDFGISSILDDNDYNITDVCGTPEFAPPSTGVGNKVKKTTAYDYGSLGLVIFYMATGYSYFANMSASEIVEAWSKGIEIPETLDMRTKMLLKGLLCDEKNRFGYKEVKDWYEGSFVHIVKPKDVIKNNNKSNISSLWFGIFNNESIEVSSISELVQQMKNHWEQAKFKLKDENFYSFLKQFEATKDIVEDIRNIVKENDEDSAVFKVIYTLSTDSDIVYKGINYGDASTFINDLSNNPNSESKELILKNLFHFYIERMGYSNEIMSIIDEVINLSNCSQIIKINILNFIFSKNKEYNGWNSIDEMRSSVSNMSLDEIKKLSNKPMFIGWLYSKGMKDLAVEMIHYGGFINE